MMMTRMMIKGGWVIRMVDILVAVMMRRRRGMNGDGKN